MTSRALYRRLLSYVVPYWRIFAGSVACMVVVAATEPAFPALMKPLLDGSFVQRDPTLTKLMPLLIIAIFMVRGVASYFGDYAIHWVSNKVVMDLRRDMFGRLMTLPTRFFETYPAGTLISRLTYDVTQVTGAATSSLTVLVKDSLTVIGLLGWLLWLNWQLTLISLAVGPVVAMVMRAFADRLRRMARGSQDAMGELHAVLDEAIGGQRVVKVFGGQEYETGRFAERINRVRRYSMKYAAAAAGTVPIVQVLAAISVSVIVYLASVQSHSEQTTVGGFVSFIIALLMLLAPLKRLTGVNESLQKGLAAAESVFGLIDQQPEADTGTVELPRARGQLAFESVRFRYPGAERHALEDVSMTVEPGETVALVGASGSGKTTLVGLVPRFHDPDAGRILLDRHDLRELRLASLRANVALVSQDVVLFNDTVAANIAYGRRSAAGRDEVAAAARAAHALEFIERMPQGFDTLIGENGVKLSGGQRQRLAIARALLKNAPVLILDEATSALDSESERQVQAALEELMKGRTTLVIAHRLSTIENADRIVVLDHGRVVEVGSHTQLIARNGAYARLHRIQYSGGA